MRDHIYKKQCHKLPTSVIHGLSPLVGIQDVTAPCRTGEAKQLGVSQCIIIACLQKLSMKLAIVRKKSPPAKTARDKRIAYFGKALLRYGYFWGGGPTARPPPKMRHVHRVIMSAHTGKS